MDQLRNKLSPALRFTFLAIVVVAVVGVLFTPATAPLARLSPPTRVTGGAPSMEALIDRFVQAIAAKDRKAIEELRLTEDEYRYLVVPGHVKPGEPPQVLREDASEYFWDVMNGKSMYHREGLLKKYGGQKLVVEKIEFEKGVHEYAGHRNHKRLRLLARDENGKEIELRSGSIVERDGQFKFASFIVD